MLNKKILCICKDVFIIYEGDDFDNLYEILSTLKNKKVNINDSLIKKYKEMLENPDFEQDYWSRTAIGKYKTGQDSISLMK